MSPIGMTKNQRYLVAGVVALLLVVLSMRTSVAAEPSVNAANSYNGVLDMYKTMAGKWEGAIKATAVKLFGTLFLLEIVWVGLQALMRQADIKEFFSELLKLIMYFGFFFALLLYSGEWAGAIIDGLRRVAAIATATNGYAGTMSPGDVLLSGLVITGKLSDSMSILPWKVLANGGIALAAIVIIVCFSAIAAFMAVVLVESWVIVGASTIFMAFGGSRWTAEYARKTLTYIVSVGAKLMVMQLIVGGGMQLINGWQAAYEADESSTFALIGIVILLAILVLKLPDLIQALISGVSVGGSGVGALAGVAATAAAGVAGAGAAVNAASNLAKAQAGGGGAAASLANAVGSAASGLGSSLGGAGGGGAGSVGSAVKDASSASSVAGPLSGRGESAAGSGSISGAGAGSSGNSSGAGTAGSADAAGQAGSGSGSAAASDKEAGQGAADAGGVADSGPQQPGAEASADTGSGATVDAGSAASGSNGAADTSAPGTTPQTTKSVVAASMTHSLRTLANLGKASLKHMGQRGMGHRMADELKARADQLNKPTL